MKATPPNEGSDRAGKEPIPPAARRAAIAGFVGTFIEYYDYSIFMVLLVYLAPLYFPAGDPAFSLIAAFAVFGVGFVGRPLGGIVFGNIGDRRGRRLALMLTIGLMGGCSALIGLLPTYASIGIFAPILLALFRLGQGFSAGSEMLGSITFVIESAPPSRRAFLAALTPLGAGLGTAGGSLVALSVGLMLSEADMASFGWRLPFLMAIPLTAIAFLLRKRVEDSPEFVELSKTQQIAKAPLREALFEHWRPMLVACGISIAANATAGMGNFFVGYLVGTRGLPFLDVTLAYTGAIILVQIGLPLAGSLTDRFGSRPMLALAFLAFIGVTGPVLYLLGSATSPLMLGVGMALYLVVIWCINAPLWSHIALLFPARVRFTAATFGANIGSMTTASTAPLAAGALILSTGSAWGPAIWIVGWSLFGLAVLLLSRGLMTASSVGAEAARSTTGPTELAAASR